jgi:hypothetical protein
MGLNDLLKKYPVVLLIALTLVIINQSFNSAKFYSLVRH